MRRWGRGLRVAHAGFASLAVLSGLSGLSVLNGCSLPPVTVATPEPIAIDINMRVDVYQHSGTEPAAPGAPLDVSRAAVEARRRARMGEIQTLKNGRLVGEGRDGLLAVRDRPPGDYGDYVERTVEAENADRTALMEDVARSEKKPLDQVRAEIASLWRERSFPGEWIEVQTAAGQWQWVQKPAGEAAAKPPEEPAP